jgi:hypothetical protein
MQLWKPTNLRNPEDGDDTFSATSIQANATRYKVPEDIFNWYHRKVIPEDSGLPILTVSLYGGAQ